MRQESNLTRIYAVDERRILTVRSLLSSQEMTLRQVEEMATHYSLFLLSLSHASRRLVILYRGSFDGESHKEGRIENGEIIQLVCS